MLHRQVGSLHIHRIVESEFPDFDAQGFFPHTKPEEWEPHRGWLAPRALDLKSNNLVFPMQSYVVKTKHHTIVVDTCVGDHKSRARPSWNMTTGGTFLKRLGEAGIQPEQVDYVMCTHMHSDHVGWNTRLVNGRWVSTFPNAKYVMSAKELEYWKDMHAKTPQNQIGDSVLPIVEAGRAHLVTNDFALSDEVWFEPTPGHTPDHVSVRMSSNGAHAVITGDLIHSPVQCAEHQWVARPDFHPDQARQTRKAFLERYCDTDVLVCASHFPSPSFGHIRPKGNAFHFVYEGESG